MFIYICMAVFISAAISLLLNRSMIVLAPRLGLMDQPDARRIHQTPIPRAGGIAIWLSFLLVLGTAHLIPGTHHAHLDSKWLIAFFSGSLVLILAGIVDDRRGLPALVKLGAHALAPLVFFLIKPIQSGFLPTGTPIVFEAALFIVWSVVLINAFNLIDGLDGLCGGLTAIASFSLAGLALLNRRYDAAILLFIMGGAVVGFLRYNLNPARIFLGDAGSMVLGFFLAAAATDAVGRKAVVGIILLPIAVAGVPLLDVLLAIWRRGARKVAAQIRGEGGTKGLFDPDRDHLHHRLLESHGSQRRVAVTLHIIAVILTTIAFLPLILGDRVVGLSIVGMIIIVLVGVRHLARVEMEQMGNVIHLAIKIPGRRRRMALALYLYDFLVLSTASAAAILIETNLLTNEENWHDLASYIVVYTSLATIFLLSARVHRRVWARATMRDIVSLNCWLLLASFLAFIVFSITQPSCVWCILRISLISHVFASIAVSMPRVSLDILREFGLEARNRSTTTYPDSPYGNTVILGAGDLGTLLLEHLKATYDHDYPGLKIIGFLDENPAIWQRRIRSITVLGGLSIIPSLIEEKGLQSIIIAINKPRPEFIDEVKLIASQHNLSIHYWNARISTSLPASG